MCSVFLLLNAYHTPGSDIVTHIYRRWSQSLVMLVDLSKVLQLVEGSGARVWICSHMTPGSMLLRNGKTHSVSEGTWLKSQGECGRKFSQRRWQVTWDLKDKMREKSFRKREQDPLVYMYVPPPRLELCCIHFCITTIMCCVCIYMHMTMLVYMCVYMFASLILL